MSLTADYVAAIIRENEQLRERVAELEAVLGVRFEAPVVMGLTGAESRLLGVLMKRDLVTKDAAMTALYVDRANDPPHDKIIDVFICKMRRKLDPYGVRIETLWGRGYRLPAKSREALVALTAQQEAA